MAKKATKKKSAAAPADEKKKGAVKGQTTLAAALSYIRKEYPEGIETGGKGPLLESTKVEAVSTGCLTLNLALGIGGLPRRRIIELFGPESGGKTTLGLSILAQLQYQGEDVAVVDAEYAFDAKYTRSVGVDTDKLILFQPEFGEQAFDVCEKLARAGIGAILVDSAAALVPRAEYEEEDWEKQSVGKQAALMSRAMRKLVGVVSRGRTIIIFINQLRESIGSYVKMDQTPAGRALKFYSSVRIDIRRTGAVKKGGESGEAIGNIVRARMVKNKVAPPFKEAEIDILFGHGIDITRDAIRAGIITDVIEKKPNAAPLTLKIAGKNRTFKGEGDLYKFLSNADNRDSLWELRDEIEAIALKMGEEVEQTGGDDEEEDETDEVKDDE